MLSKLYQLYEDTLMAEWISIVLNKSSIIPKAGSFLHSRQSYPNLMISHEVRTMIEFNDCNMTPDYFIYINSKSIPFISCNASGILSRGNISQHVLHFPTNHVQKKNSVESVERIFNPHQ